MNMGAPKLALVVMVLACACGAETESEGSGGETGSATTGGETSGGTFETSPVTTAGSADDTSTSTGGGTSAEDDGMGFVLMPDSGEANECDPKAQDCPEGDKCTAWANDGGTFWNANRCVPVSGEGVGGDECTVEGSGVSGLDDCTVGFICMNTDENGLGTCIAFCQGQDEDCEPGQVCAVYNNGVLPICLTSCDPLLQDCPGGQSCIDTPNQRFICFNDASGMAGGDGDPCPPEHGENSCDPGLWCGPDSAGCTDVNCCTPYCDLSAPACTSPDECVSFYGDPNAAPPGFEDVGVCVLP